MRSLLLLALALFLVPAAEGAPAAPSFRVKVLDSQRTIDSRDLLGKKIIVVRFQASWCKPCAKESAGLARLAERYRARGVEVLALHVQDTATDARRFIRAHKATYPVALDPKLVVGNRFGVKGTPHTLVIDRKGEIVARINGQSAVTRLPRILDEVLKQDGR